MTVLLLFAFLLGLNAQCTFPLTVDSLDGPFLAGQSAYIVNSSRGFFLSVTSIYMTSDGGISFQRLDDTVLTNYSRSAGWFVVSQSTTASILHIFSRNGEKWSTYDGGDTFTFSLLGMAVTSVQAHPVTPNLFLLLGGGQVFLSQDSGASFPRIASTLSNIVSMTWAKKNDIFILDSASGSLYYSADLFATAPKTPLTFITQFLYFPAENVLLCVGISSNPVTVYFLDGGAAFVNIKRFPVLGTEVAGSIRVFQSNANNTFAVVARQLFPNQAQLFVTNSRDNGDFYLSLDRVYYNGLNGRSDALSVANIPQVLMANTFNAASNLISVISFDAGLSWGPLNLSPTDYAACGISGCSLHFFGPVDNELALLSGNIQTKGLIVVKGSVGLSRGSAPTGIWISTDAGQTFYSTQFAFADFRQTVVDIGRKDAYLVAASTVATTPGANTLIFYSGNGGQTISSCNYTDPDADLALNRSWKVVSIVSDADFFSNQFVSLTTIYDFWLTSQYTYTNASGSVITGYQIFPLDLGNPPTCTSLTSFSIPLDSATCNLGHVELYDNVKPLNDACQGPDVTSSLFSSGCPCTEKSYYCALCYVKNSNGTCLKDTSINSYCQSSLFAKQDLTTTAPSPCSGTWLKKSPYYAVAGNLCTPGTVKLDASTNTTCPSNKNYNEAWIIYVSVLGGIFVFMLILFLIIGYAPQAQPVREAAANAVQKISPDNEVELDPSASMTQVDLSTASHG